MNRHVAVVVAGLLAGVASPALAESGDYAFEVPLAAVSPEGDFPIRVETPTFLAEGTIHIELDVYGRLTATADFPTRSVSFTGKFAASGGREAVSLRVPGRGGARLRGALTGTTFSGTFVDGGSLTRGSGTFTIDVSSAHPLVAAVTASAHGGFGAVRRGTGTVVAEDSSGSVDVFVTPSTRTSLRVRGLGFRCTAAGTFGPTALDVTTWKANGFGAGASGTTLGVTHDPVPDVSLILSNGDANEAAPGADPADLSSDAGPFLAHWLEGRGLEVTTTTFADADEDEENPGYSGMVAKLTELRDTLVTGRTFPTRIVVVSLGHGGVRAHAAIRDVPDAPAAVVVDLDATSCGWDAQGHDTDAIGGTPVGAVMISGEPFDLTDVVFDNVVASLDVHSVSNCPDALTGSDEPIPYDARVHRRLDGTITGVSFLFTETTHDELHDVFGETLPRVAKWLSSTLAPRAKR